MSYGLRILILVFLKGETEKQKNVDRGGCSQHPPADRMSVALGGSI